MIAEILSTGDEIRSGTLIDNNSAYIAQQLEQWGVEVVRHNCVGDELDFLVPILKEIGRRVDIAIVTGGLGPTADDLSSEAAAKASGVALVLDSVALKSIEAFFKKRKRLFTSSNKKQAMLPKNAKPIYNPVGTAPGFIIKIEKCVFFFLPGVPYEMRKMLTGAVLPEIEKLQGGNRKLCLVKTISTFGLTESATGEQLTEFASAFPEIKLGFRAKFPEIHVKLYAYGDDKGFLEQLIKKATEWVMEKLGKRIISVDGGSIENVVGGLLCREKATIAVAESCTGGLISNWLTDVPGSSEYFLFSGVTYSNEAKIKVLGVSPDTIIQYGAVHEETVKEMAEGVRRIADATYGLSTSGIAGPDGGTEDKPVGTVCIGLATPDTVKGYRFNFLFNQRLMNKKIFAMTALDLLRREFLEDSYDS